ncbi:hypothetical protein [Nocardiopsis synnemataformans]|uniref:hypothetical protein n=1 Tax=Nocardiopsis synnemataformans TaxID=61305 RepID=UPI003EB91473
MADLATQTTHTLTLTTEELGALRRALAVAQAATEDDPKAAKDREAWKRLARVGKSPLRGDQDETAPATPRPTIWGTGGRTHGPKPTRGK